jgi:hypothetical protein
MRSNSFKGIGHPSTCSTFFDKATRLIAGPHKSLAMEAYNYSNQVVDNRQTIFLYYFQLSNAALWR